jgi:hypothetical protein
MERTTASKRFDLPIPRGQMGFAFKKRFFHFGTMQPVVNPGYSVWRRLTEVTTGSIPHDVRQPSEPCLTKGRQTSSIGDSQKRIGGEWRGWAGLLRAR